MFGRKNIGIDLGTTSIRILVDNKGVVINDKSVMAVDKNTGRVLKLGREASAMIGRAPQDVEIIRPLQGGVVKSYDPTSYMMQQYIKQACGGVVFNPRVMICTPSNITDVEQKAVESSAYNAGAREIYLIAEPLAAAFGAGIKIDSDKCKLVVDIGGGTTDIAIVVNGQVIVSDSVKVAGDRFNQEIMNYVRAKHGLVIGEKTAEEIKKNIGWVGNHKDPLTYVAKGRSAATGLPAAERITSLEMMDALKASLLYLKGRIVGVIERASAEIKDDLFASKDYGLVLTGGGSLLRGLPEYMHAMTNIKTWRPDNPELCVIRGTGVALANIDRFKADAKKNKIY